MGNRDEIGELLNEARERGMNKEGKGSEEVPENGSGVSSIPDGFIDWAEEHGLGEINSTGDGVYFEPDHAEQIIDDPNVGHKFILWDWRNEKINVGEMWSAGDASYSDDKRDIHSIYDWKNFHLIRRPKYTEPEDWEIQIS